MKTTYQRLMVFGVLSLALLLVAACGGAAPTAAPAQQPEATATPIPPTATPEPPPEEPPTPTAEPVEESETPSEEPPAPTAEPIEEPETPSETVDTPEAMSGDPEAGFYIFNAAIGCGCHFNRDTNALAGGNKFEGPFGVVHAANLTPDNETGLGAWSDEEIANAVRFGQRPDTSASVHGMEDGTNLSFIMPNYASMSDKDAMDLVAYLRTLEPVSNDIPQREFNFPVQAFEPDETPPEVAPTDPIERGHYLVNLARCTFCHTPNNEQGGKDMTMFLAGAPFRDTVAPNLSSDELTGLGAWSDEELVDFLTTGIYFDGSEAAGAMKGQIDRGISKLTQEDVEAIVAFLRSLPPIQNEPATPQ